MPLEHILWHTRLQLPAGRLRLADAHIVKGGRVIFWCFHDATTRRITSRQLTLRPVALLHLPQQLAQPPLAVQLWTRVQAFFQQTKERTGSPIMTSPSMLTLLSFGATILTIPMAL